MSFELLRVLRDGWTLDRFVDDMASILWTTAGHRSPFKAAAVLAASKDVDR